jgi:hypothetical protein
MTLSVSQVFNLRARPQALMFLDILIANQIYQIERYKGVWSLMIRRVVARLAYCFL